MFTLDNTPKKQIYNSDSIFKSKKWGDCLSVSSQYLLDLLDLPIIDIENLCLKYTKPKWALQENDYILLMSNAGCTLKLYTIDAIDTNFPSSDLNTIFPVSPFIGLVWTGPNNGHAIVIKRVKNGYAEYFDPTYGCHFEISIKNLFRIIYAFYLIFPHE